MTALPSTSGCRDTEAGGADRRVAVVVPVHNGAATLERSLSALTRSRRRPSAVVVVDDASTDRSAAIARHSGATVLRTGDAPLGPGAARNRGVEAVDTGFVAFVDSDVELRPETLDLLIAPLVEDLSVVAAFGSYDDDPDSRRTAALYANLRHHHVHQSARLEAGTFWSGCGVVRRDAFLAVGGFDEDTGTAEDIALGVRLRDAGGRVRLVPEAQCKHLKDWSPIQLWRTDIFLRAIPWTRLMARRGELSDQLNAGWRHRFSAIAAHLIWLLLLCAAFVGLGPALLALAVAAAWLALNRPLLALLARRGGSRGVAGGALLHWLYDIYASLTFATVWLLTRFERDGRAGAPGGHDPAGPSAGHGGTGAAGTRLSARS